MDESGANLDRFRKRSRIVFLILLIWGILAAAHTVWYSWYQRDKLLAESTGIAWREGEIPPVRGKILSSDSKELVRSVLLHDLYISGSSRVPSLLRRLKSELTGLQETEVEPGKILLKKNLSPEEINSISGLFRRTPELYILPRMERMLSAGVPEETIGKTGPDGDLQMHGVSGLELKHDRELSGTPGVFRVMLDSRGNWVPGTLEVIRQPVAGKDVILETTWKELTDK